MYKILTLNKISDIIHESLSADKYLISAEEPVPEGILVRSADMHSYETGDELLAVARAGAGVNNIPIDAFSKKGIAVFNTPGANANAVAELVICGMMLAGRKVSEGINWARTLKEDVAKQVEKGKGQFIGPEVRGKTLGIIGLGAIGAIVANAASQGLGMEVIGYDPYISVEHAWSLSRSVHHAGSMEEIFQKADYITIHVPLTDSTKGLIGEASIAKMKDGVRILNFARAGLCDTEALGAALDNGKVAAYVTDFPTEEVLKLKNTVVLPHLGASTPESEENCAAMAAKELRDYLERGQICNSVNLPQIVLGEPDGVRVQLIHGNQPGLISAISAAIGARKININNMINKSRGETAVTVLELAGMPDHRLLNELNALPGVVRVRVFG